MSTAFLQAAIITWVSPSFQTCSQLRTTRTVSRNESSLKREVNEEKQLCHLPPLNLYLKLACRKLSHFSCDHTPPARQPQLYSTILHASIACRPPPHVYPTKKDHPAATPVILP
ncbi:hypothetical protein E2C01_008400 [Portunus trituberculatus]|uniref:Uncharacterized protein n=1 Tax=Portunus trituberculatus TaxID=210409 RepID=A0A5B7D311_PORTR|nr:hypothetical protein [Portunus trituberculatus]